MSASRTPLVPVSIGELIDKITILEIKVERIEDAGRVAHAQKELAALRGIAAALADESITAYAQELKTVNESLWQVEDTLRLYEREQRFTDEFVAAARSVYILNDRRAHLKLQINQAARSDLVEVKSYATY